MKFFNLLFFLLSVSILNAQLKFENSSLQNIYAKAKRENKLIFLQLESAQCNQCNEVADKAFSKYFPDSIKNNFLFVKLDVGNKDRVEIDNRFNSKNSSGTLFLNSEGELVHRFRMTTSRTESYFEQCTLAIQKAKNAGSISEDQKMYDSGNQNIDFLENYLNKRRELRMSTDTLLDKYVTDIPVDSVRSLRVLKFIAIMAPALDSRADSVLRNDHTLFMQAWNSIPLQQRININSQVIFKSKQRAINSKNINDLLKVASYARSAYGNKEGEKQYLKTQVDYYQGIKDTINYIAYAVNYYDTYFMTVTLDQLQKTDSVRIKVMQDRAPADTVNLGEGIINLRRSISFIPLKEIYANELNRAAWTFYKMSNDTAVLNKALQWSRKSIELSESSGLMDTYARLLYKTGNNNDAIAWEEKAIDFLKHHGFSATEFERTLLKMKQNDVVIDN